jgi:hypothetical protein
LQREWFFATVMWSGLGALNDGWHLETALGGGGIVAERVRGKSRGRVDE